MKKKRNPLEGFQKENVVTASQAVTWYSELSETYLQMEKGVWKR